MRYHTTFDISNDLQLVVRPKGVQLLKPSKAAYANGSYFSVKNISDLPFNVFFLDRDSTIQHYNEPAARMASASSLNELVGKTVRKLQTRDSAEQVIRNDKSVIKNKDILITDELFATDFSETSLIVYKTPLFNEEAKLVGIMGCALLLTSTSANQIANFIKHLKQVGLLQLPYLAEQNQAELGFVSKNIYFTKRENDIVKHLICGRTARTIGNLLGISHRTVEQYIEQLKGKTQTTSKFDLVEKLILLARES